MIAANEQSLLLGQQEEYDFDDLFHFECLEDEGEVHAEAVEAVLVEGVDFQLLLTQSVLHDKVESAEGSGWDQCVSQFECMLFDD